MNHKLKNTLYTCLLGTIFLTNVINFHGFAHLFESDDHSYVECDYCTLLAQKEDNLNFYVSSFDVTFQNTAICNIYRDCISVPQIVKKTIITDYFFNKPPPAQFSI